MRVTVTAILSLLALVAMTVAALAAGEEILSFKSEITIHQNATVTIVETIQVRSTGDKIKRGIYRDFPTDYKDRYGNTVRVSFDILKTVRGDAPVNHWVESIPGGKRVYMGHKDRFIQPGLHVFQLTYRTDQQIGHYDGFDELAWNVTGDKWDFPILSAVSEIHLPQGTSALEKVAYTGRYGSTEQAVVMETETPRKVRFQSTRILNPGEGMTVAVSWPKGFVTEPTKAEGAWLLLKANADLAAAIAGFLVVLSYYLIAWAYVGRDPKPGTIIPRFKPPDDMSPAAVRYLIRTKFDDTTFATSIVSLAVKGVLRIEEAGGVFTLIKGSDDYGSLSEGEISVVKELFAHNRSSISLQDTNHIAIGHARENLESTLQREIDDVYLKENSNISLGGVLLSFAVVGLTLYFSSTVATQGMEMEGLALLAAPLIGLFRPFGFIVIKAVIGLAAMGFTRFLTYAFGVVIVILMVLAIMQASSSWFVVGLIIAISILPVIFNYLLKAPTLDGRQVLDKVLGFKLYLSVAEKHRLEAMHPPEETPELFEKFMPYAIALGVGDIWSKRFSDHLAVTGGIDTAATGSYRGYRPRWYSSRNWSGKSVSNLGRNLGKPFSGAVGVAATAPASTSRDSFTSGGGGFSSGGFGGGGGFSGGGGGGGGGGGF